MDRSSSNISEVLAIFSRYWVSNEQSDVAGASTVLCHLTTISANPGQYIYNTLLALHSFATTCPTSIDFLVRVYATAVDQFPNSVESEYGTGSLAGEEQLSWWLVDETNLFSVTERPVSLGRRDPCDPSNIEFPGKDVNERLMEVLDTIQKWREERQNLFICAVIQARCFALGAVRVKFPDGYGAETFIDCAIERNGSEWSQADFIAGCLLLRGCAKSLTEALRALGKEDKLDQWRSKFQIVLHRDEASEEEQQKSHDWVVKSNAAVRLAVL